MRSSLARPIRCSKNEANCALRVCARGLTGGRRLINRRGGRSRDANAAAADLIFERLKSPLAQKRIEPFAAKHLRARDLAPIGIGPLRMEQVERHRIHVRQAEHQKTIGLQKPMRRRQRRYGIGKPRQLIVKADDGEPARRVEAFDRLDMPLKAELAQAGQIRRIAFKPDCLEAEFRSGEQQGAAAEANIEPGGIAIARADVACNGRNEGRDGAPSHFHILAEGRRCKGAGSKIAVGEHMVAIFANMPLDLRRQFAAIGRVFAAIGAEKEFVRAAAAERACRIDVTRDLLNRRLGLRLRIFDWCPAKGCAGLPSTHVSHICE